MQGKVNNDKSKALDYWLSSSQDDLESAQTLFRSKKYHHSLFFYHLSLEKLLKAKIVDLKDKSPLPVHNLVVLAKELGLDLSEKDNEELREISNFNLNARYDSYKFDFFKKATLKFTQEWVKIIEKWQNRIMELWQMESKKLKN